MLGISLLLGASVLVSSVGSESWNHQIISPTGQRLTLSELSDSLSKAGIVVLGENHNDESIQIAEAILIESIAEKANAFGKFSVGWEFLDSTSQEINRSAFSEFMQSKIGALEFLKQTQHSIYNSSYVSVLETVKAIHGELLGLNLSRREKASVVKDGIQALDPKLLPPNYERGSLNYFERFKQAMGGHATNAQLEHYFDAQCLTDDVMAHSLLRDSKFVLKFLVAGHFHTDYSEGVVERLKKRAPTNTQIKVIRIENASHYTAAELNDLIRPDPVSGNAADYFYFVGEPREEQPSRSP